MAAHVPLQFITICFRLVLAYRCHLGESTIHDTVTNLSRAVGLRAHGIVAII